MTCERGVMAAIACPGVGLGLILGYCHDSTISFSAAHPASAATLQFVIDTNGWPAMAGLAATVVGILLLFAALAFAVLRADSAAWQRTARECFRWRKTLTFGV